MDCPQCNVEMNDLADGEMTVRRCGQCGGVWIDVADLNRLLLHRNMPALQSLGGRMNVEAASGQCPDCQVDLVAIEGGERRSLSYETCESCGGIFIEKASDTDDAHQVFDGIIDFYKRFQRKGAVA